jgi:hypothetical protein
VYCFSATADRMRKIFGDRPKAAVAVDGKVVVLAGRRRSVGFLCIRARLIVFPDHFDPEAER